MFWVITPTGRGKRLKLAVVPVRIWHHPLVAEGHEMQAGGWGDVQVNEGAPAPTQFSKDKNFKDAFGGGCVTMKLVKVKNMAELKHYELGDYLRAYKVIGGILIFYTIDEVKAWENDEEYTYEIVESTKYWPWPAS